MEFRILPSKLSCSRLPQIPRKLGISLLAAVVILVHGCAIDTAPRRVSAELPATAAPTDQSEPSVAIDPTNTDRILVGAIEVDAELCRFMTSADGGETWTSGLLGTADRQSCTDPSVAFDADGNAYFAGFFHDSGFTNSGIGVAKSIDGGQTFAPPVIFGGGHLQQSQVDKPYIAVDTTGGALDGAVHVVWNTISLATCDDSFCPRAIWIATSFDGGATFSAPLKASGTITGGSNNFAASAAVAPDGQVYVAWRQFHRFLGAFPGTWQPRDSILVRRIDTSARTLDPEVEVAFLDQQHANAEVQGTFRTTRYPIVGVSNTPGTEGDVYIVFADDPPQSETFKEPPPPTSVPVPGMPPPSPPEINVVPTGINKWGRIVGHSTTETGTNMTTSGFYQNIQEFRYINIYGTAMSVATDLNDHDTVIGYYLDGIGFEHGFTLHAGGFSTVRTPIFPFSYPAAIHTRPFGINNAGRIVGSYSDTNITTHGFVFENGVFDSIDYPGAIATQARGVNEQGVIVGRYLDNSDGVHGFMLDGGTFTTVDHPTGSNTVVHDINSSGVMVGSHEVSGQMRAFVYDGTSFSMPAGGGSEALGISDNGQIVGRATIDGFIDNGLPSQEIWMTRSGDQGVTWMPLHRVNDDMHGDQFDPWMSTGPFGQVHIAWLDRRRDPQNFLYDAYYAATSDGGQTFTENQRLSTASSDPRLASITNSSTGGGFIGEYIGVAADPEIAHVVWPDLRDTSASGQDIYHASVSCNIIDLGDGTVADTCAGVTWLKDANYADTLGLNPTENGAMAWDDAFALARDLEFVGYDDWRLPEGRFPDFNCDEGATPFIGINCIGSELGYLYYARGITASDPGPFTNIPDNPAWYWGSRYNSPLLSPTIGNPGRAWAFKLQSGEMGSANAGSTSEVYVWPVRDIKVTDTFPGADSEVKPVPDVTVTFTNVMTGGATTVETTDLNPQPDPTITFTPPFHQIVSTANYDPDIQICLGYDPASLPGGQLEANLRIAQLVGGNWSIIPAPPGTVDESGNVVCAPTTAVGWVVVVGT